MKQTSYLIGTLLAAVLITGCTSVLNSAATGRSLLERLPVAHRSGESAGDAQSLEMLFGMARVAERNGRSKQAAVAYEEILSDHPKHVPSLHRLGVIAAKNGHIDRAMDHFLEAVRHEEPSAELLGDIGYTQYLASDHDAAAETLQHAVHKDPNNKRIVNNLAIVLGMQQRFEDSLDVFRQTGTEAESLASVAFTQSQTGHLAEAKATYHRSLEIDSSLNVAANGLVELDKATPRLGQRISEGVEQPRVSRAAINVSFPGGQKPTDLTKTPARKSMEAIKSLAAAVRPSVSERDSINAISKPPVIAMPRAEGVVTREKAAQLRSSSAEQSVARIVMGAIAQPTTAPAALPPIVRSPADAEAMPSNRRLRAATNPAKPSFIRQVVYEQAIE